MRAAFIRKYGKNEVVELGELPRPPITSRDVLIKIHAASVNPVDFKLREGGLRLLRSPPMPIILGNDLSGVVAEVGSEVTTFVPGDEVFARVDKDRIGTFCDYAAVQARHVARKPKNLSHVEAAAIPLVGLTAWQALTDFGSLGAGQKVLIHAASGGVGTLAIQLAKHLGVTVAVTFFVSWAGDLRDVHCFPTRGWTVAVRVCTAPAESVTVRVTVLPAGASVVPVIVGVASLVLSGALTAIDGAAVSTEPLSFPVPVLPAGSVTLAVTV